jgi:hypothetical protein
LAEGLSTIRVEGTAPTWSPDQSLMFTGDGYPLSVNKAGKTVFADGTRIYDQFTPGTPVGLSDGPIGMAQARLDFINANYYDSPNYHNNGLTYGIASVANWVAGTGEASPVIPGSISTEYDQLRAVLAVNASSAQVQAVLNPDAMRINSDDWMGALNPSRETSLLQRAQHANVLISQVLSPAGRNASITSSSIAERRMAWSTLAATGQFALEAFPNTFGMGAAYAPQALRAGVGAAGDAARATGQWLTPKAAEMVDSLAYRSGMRLSIVEPGPSLGNAANSLAVHPNYVGDLPFSYKAGPFQRFVQRFGGEFSAAGFDDAQGFMQGSAASGVKYSTGEALNARMGVLPSDYDVAVVSPKLAQRAQELGLNVFKGPLSADEIGALGLTDAQNALSAASKYRLPVNFKIYDSTQAVFDAQKTIPFSDWMQ